MRVWATQNDKFDFKFECKKSRRRIFSLDEAEMSRASRFLLSVATAREARRSIFVIDEADEQGQRSV